LTAEDFESSIRSTVPLAQTAAEKITVLRKWAKGRARPATTPDASTVSTGRKLDV
jgi:hypothetical protein